MHNKNSNNLDIRKIIREFEKQESEGPHRKDALKIDKPFEEALEIILSIHGEERAKPKKFRK